MPYAVDLKTPRDLVEKAKRELDRLESAEQWGRSGQGDHAWNCAVTVWQVTDWLAYGAPDALRTAGLPTTYAGLRDHVIAESRALKICYELALGSKHLVIDRELEGPRILAMEASVTAGATARGPGFLKVQLDDGTRERVIAIFQQALDFWDRLFARCGL